MATLLGTATLSSTFINDITGVSVATDDLNRVTQTDYRRPIAASILDTGSIPGGAGITDERPLYTESINRYLDAGYLDDIYVSGDSAYVDIIDGVIYCAYDILDIDPAATIANVEIQLSVASTVGSGMDRGNVRVQWAENGKATTTSSRENNQAGPTTLTDASITTMDFTITPDGTYWDGEGMGTNPLLRINFQEGGGSKTGCRLYSARIRINYTGRTRLTTGYITPSTLTGGTYSNDVDPYTLGNQPGAKVDTSGYGFAISSQNNIDGVAVRFGAIGTEDDGTGQVWGPLTNNNSLHFVSGGSVVSNASMPTDASMYLWGDTDRVTYYSSYDDHNSAGLTTSEVNAGDFGMETRWLITAGTSENLKQPFVFDVNIAHIPPILSGDIGISTVSTVSATPVITHAFNDDEIDDFTGVFTTTTLGGFLLEATATPNTAFTTTLGLAGRTRTGFTVTISDAFAATMTAELGITASALTFPAFTTTVSSVVERTTPATASAEFTQSFTEAALGLIRTGFTATAPAAANMATITGITLLKAVDPDRTLVTDTQTRTYLIPLQGEDRAHERTLYIPQQTRTHTIPLQGEDRAHERVLYVPQQTRSVKVEGM